jgi:hypothetical protein
MNTIQNKNNISIIQNKKIISGSTLKIIAIITMLIDHTAAILITNDSFLSITMRSIGRIAFPIFVFLLIEGAIHTHSKLKYAIRLSLFAILSEIPFDLAFHKKFFFFGYQNVFFTLAIGMFMIIGFDLISTRTISKILLNILSFLGFIAPTIFIMWIYHESFLIQTRILPKTPDLNASIFYCFVIFILLLLTSFFLISRKKRNGLLAAQKTSTNLLIFFSALTISFLLKSDYSIMGILAIAIMYILRALKTQSFFFGCLILIIFQPFEIPSLLGLIPISKYNGTRGLKLKYFFYIFYPSHLLLLYFISLLIKNI